MKGQWAYASSNICLISKEGKGQKKKSGFCNGGAMPLGLVTKYGLGPNDSMG